MSFRYSLLLLLVSSLLVTLLAGLACREKDVPYVVDEDEIARYIGSSLLGKEFFGTDNLIMADTFRIASSPDTVFRIHVDNVRRMIEMDITPENVGKEFLDNVLPPGPAYGWRDAEVEVTDTLGIRIEKATTTDTTFSSAVAVLVRRGWFVKYGDDSQPYVGWLLFGFTGSSAFSPVRVDLTAESGYTVRGDSLTVQRFLFKRYVNSVFDSTVRASTFAYRRIDDTTKFLKIPEGTVVETATSPVAGNSTFQLLTFPTTDGARTVAMPQVSGDYSYSVTVPDAPGGSWRRLVFIETRSGSFRKMWCVPYRVWP